VCEGVAIHLLLLAPSTLERYLSFINPSEG